MRTRIEHWTRALRSDQRGLTTVEYVIVLCLIAAVGVKTWQEFGVHVDGWLGGADTTIGNELSNVGSGEEPGSGAAAPSGGGG